MMEMDEVSTTTASLGNPSTPADYEETIALMQAQIDIQKEKIRQLVDLTQELKIQVQELRSWKDSVASSNEQVFSSDGKAEGGLALDWANQDGARGVSIVDLVKQTAEQVVAKQEASSSTGFVYNEESGWYFDTSTGFYYDPRTKLTYSVHEKKYYKYDTDRKEYMLYPTDAAELELSKAFSRPKRRDKQSKKVNYSNPAMQLTDATTTDEKRSQTTNNKPKTKKKMKHKSKILSKKPKEEAVDNNELNMEEGEIPSSASSKSVSDPESDDDNISSSCDSSSTSTYDESDDMCKVDEPAPCIRAVVMKSPAPDLKKGTLFIVTCMGGTIGREGSQHAILISDSNMSKVHASITYEQIDGTEDTNSPGNVCPTKRSPSYYISDSGSKNGTFLNGKRITENKSEVVHGSTLKVGDTLLLLHIHPGQFTCGHCEPGLIIEKEPMYAGPILSKEKKESLRKKEMKKIRKKFGISNDATSALSKLPTIYTDRAEERRIKKGSDNPFEKTQVTSIDEPIKEDNRGYEMMKKMGWSDGVSLGQTGERGIKEPIKFELKSGRSGLGSQNTAVGAAMLGPGYPRKNQTSRSKEVLMTVKKRYDEIAEPDEDLK